MSRRTRDRLQPGRDKKGRMYLLRQRCRRRPLQRCRGSPAFAVIPGDSQTFAIMRYLALPELTWVAPSLNASFVVSTTNGQEHEKHTTHLRGLARHEMSAGRKR